MHHLIVFAALITVTFGCICAPPRFNRRLSYCKADFTIKGTVKEYRGIGKPASSDHPHKKYIMWPGPFYRNPSSDWKSIVIYTPLGSNHCEVDLKVNGTYIFNGKYYHDQYIINRCEWNEDWNRVPRWVKIALPYFYIFC